MWLHSWLWVELSALDGVRRNDPARCGEYSTRPSGAVYAWGDDDAGQLANGNVTVKGHNYDEKSPEPADMPAGTLAVSLAAGQSHSLAATTTGSVFAWGFNGNGQLGTGNTNATTLPMPVAMPPGANVTSVAAGFKQSYALTSSGQIYAWGLNKDGQLGTGSTKSQSDLPESVKSARRGHRDGDRGRGVPRAGGRQRRHTTRGDSTTTVSSATARRPTRTRRSP